MQRSKCLLYSGGIVLIWCLLVLLLRNPTVGQHPYIKRFQTKIQDTVQSIQKPFLGETEKKLTQKVELSKDDEISTKECISSKDEKYKESLRTFWPGNTREIRFTSHSYLKKDSIVVDVGGNAGADAEEFLKRYGSKIIIFEPLPSFCARLKKKFKKKDNVKILEYGLGKKNEKRILEVSGKDGDASSLYTGKNVTKGEKVQIKNAGEVFQQIGVEKYSLDLLHLDCEGCEIDVLESLLHMNIAKNLKHIQFATHTQYSGVKDLVPRYCKLREILKKTHKPMYDYQFVWESWELK